MAKVDKYSIYGLKRRPTYEEIIGVIDESNEKITGKLPDRSATMFRNSQEGSDFDRSNAMEQLKEEQGRLLLRQMSELLLRQNVRTAGRTYHTERMQRLPTTSPVIAQPTQPMDVDAELTQQATPTIPSSSTTQASHLNAELTQRANTATKRREETAMNHRGEVFKQSKPTIPEQIHHINPPRSFTPIKLESFNIATDDEVMPQAKAKPQTKPKAKASASSSSSQALPVVEVMDVSSSSKRASPETTIEPRGKAGRPATSGARASRPKMFKEGAERKNADKRDGSSPEEEPKMRKKRNKKKTELEIGGAEADDEIDEPKDSGKRKTIQKPIGASTIGVQRLREEFVNAKNKDMITKEQYEQFDSAYKTWFASKGNDSKKKQMLKQMREVYKLHLWQKLKDMYKSQ